MMAFSEEFLNYVREDLANDMILTKFQMVSEFTLQCKKENPSITETELMTKIAQFRIKNGWDRSCPKCKQNAGKIMHQDSYYCIHCDFVFDDKKPD